MEPLCIVVVTQLANGMAEQDVKQHAEEDEMANLGLTLSGLVGPAGVKVQELEFLCLSCC